MKILKIFPEKFLIKLVVEALHFLAEKSSNKLDDKIVEMVRKQLELQQGKN